MEDLRTWEMLCTGKTLWKNIILVKAPNYFLFPWTYFFFKMYTNSKNNNMLYIDPVDVTLPAFPTLGCTWQTCQSLRRAYLETQMKGSLISPKWERYENKDISIVKDNIPKLLPAAPFFGWIKNKLNFYSNFQIVNKKCHFQNSVNSLDYLTLYRKWYHQLLYLPFGSKIVFEMTIIRIPYIQNTLH